MDIQYSKNSIRFNKVLNALDKLTVDFTSVLNGLNIKYVLVSGYVSILFGRNRSSEDIDIIIERLHFDKFKKLWIKLDKKFECITTHNQQEAFSEYLMTSHAVRFSRKNEFIPNIEIKFPKIELETWTLNNRKKVIVTNKVMFISSLELQISFKLYLGSEKDIEDAKYLYELFKEKLDLSLLEEFNRKLKIVDLFNKYLR